MRPPHEPSSCCKDRVQIELRVPDTSFHQFGGNSLGQNLPPTSLILSLASWLFG
jgi:hypothetical protein